MPPSRSPALGAALLAALSAFPAAGQTPAPPDTLRLGAVLDALPASPTLRAARLAAEAAEAEARAAGAWPDPTLGLTVQPLPV
ncbi:MAG: hypothetical protein R3181_06445, partial [Rubricoccaceae bacterium]|nr:hypothetical protein [Rubricoccaceae bacterium]